MFTDKLIGGFRPIALRSLGANKFAMMKEDIAEKVITMLPDSIDLSDDYTTEALDLEKTIFEKLKSLSPQEFREVLCPAAQRSEFALMFTGGVLRLCFSQLKDFILNF